MKTFLDFVNESAPMNKAQYAEVRRKLGRELENAFKSATNTYLNSLAPNPADRSENDTFQDLYYSKPDTIPSFKSFGKKLDKFKGADRESPVFKAYLAAWESMKDRVAEVDAMKDGVVSATTQREVKKSAEVAKIQKYVKDNGALINVLNSNREEYKREAGDRAAKQYDYYAEVLKAAGYNLDVAAPIPESRIGREAYRAMQNKRDVLSRASGGTGKPSEAFKARHVQQAILVAEASFDEWVAKMVQKIGKDVKSATMSGNPWTGSVLRVETVDGESQVWKTQMIINSSKYGKMFNQFPSRQM